MKTYDPPPGGASRAPAKKTKRRHRKKERAAYKKRKLAVGGWVKRDDPRHEWLADEEDSDEHATDL